jgi:hypothetical protein
LERTVKVVRSIFFDNLNSIGLLFHQYVGSYPVYGMVQFRLILVGRFFARSPQVKIFAPRFFQNRLELAPRNRTAV